MVLQFHLEPAAISRILMGVQTTVLQFVNVIVLGHSLRMVSSGLESFVSRSVSSVNNGCCRFCHARCCRLSFRSSKMLQLPKSFVETADAQEEAPVAEEPATEDNTEEHRQFTTPLQLCWLQQRQRSTRSTAPHSSGMVWITLLWEL